MQPVNEFTAHRLEKLEKLRALGVNPYPARVQRSHHIGDVLVSKDQFTDVEVTLCGRITALRDMGKSAFLNITDESGKIQLYVKKDLLDEITWQMVKLLDLGDFLQASGTCFLTHSGEFSVKVNSLVLLCKSLRPLPVVKEREVDGKMERYDEFADIELRYRKRYLDLLLNPGNRQLFYTRSAIITRMRSFLSDLGYCEVETPVLQPLYGGANARPFITKHNTLDMTLYLRIATELYLKRLVVGGMEKVYEIGKDFRNEGMDRTHNPEFTMLEIYSAFGDLETMITLTQNLVMHLVDTVIGRTQIEYDNMQVDFATPWRRAGMAELINEHTGIDVMALGYEELLAACKAKKLDVPAQSNWGKLVELLFGEFVEPRLINPTFVTDYPAEISPLAKPRDDNPQLVERFELFVAGHELANAFSELNNPVVQRQNLEGQSRLKALGDQEANVVDEDFLEALEYGMPPMGGMGMGVDRLVMLLTGIPSIKEIILFPQMRPDAYGLPQENAPEC